MTAKRASTAGLGIWSGAWVSRVLLFMSNGLFHAEHLQILICDESISLFRSYKDMLNFPISLGFRLISSESIIPVCAEMEVVFVN